MKTQLALGASFLCWSLALGCSSDPGGDTGANGKQAASTESEQKKAAKEEPKESEQKKAAKEDPKSGAEGAKEESKSDAEGATCGGPDDRDGKCPTGYGCEKEPVHEGEPEPTGTCVKMDDGGEANTE
jgi:hypothetical protein